MIRAIKEYFFGKKYDEDTIIDVVIELIGIHISDIDNKTIGRKYPLRRIPDVENYYDINFLHGNDYRDLFKLIHIVIHNLDKKRDKEFIRQISNAVIDTSYIEINFDTEMDDMLLHLESHENYLFPSISIRNIELLMNELRFIRTQAKSNNVRIFLDTLILALYIIKENRCSTQV